MLKSKLIIALLLFVGTIVKSQNQITFTALTEAFYRNKLLTLAGDDPCKVLDGFKAHLINKGYQCIEKNGDKETWALGWEPSNKAVAWCYIKDSKSDCIIELHLPKEHFNYLREEIKKYCGYQGWKKQVHGQNSIYYQSYFHSDTETFFSVYQKRKRYYIYAYRRNR
jgi:hypothetical protein